MSVITFHFRQWLQKGRKRQVELKPVKKYQNSKDLKPKSKSLSVSFVQNLIHWFDGTLFMEIVIIQTLSNPNGCLVNPVIPSFQLSPAWLITILTFIKEKILCQWSPTQFNVHIVQSHVTTNVSYLP